MTFKTCCYCLSLRTGSILIGVSDVITLFVSFFYSPFYIIFGGLINTIATCLMIYGAISNKSTFLWCWIYVKIIIIGFIAVALAFSVMSLIIQVIKGNWHNLTVILIFGGITAILIVHVLLITVVYSFAYKLREDKKRPSVNSQALSV